MLALECDGASYHSSQSARDRDRLRQEQLERLGWRFCRIWSSEWFHNKERAVEKVLSAYALAVKAADEADSEDAEPQSTDNPSDVDDSGARILAVIEQTLDGDDAGAGHRGSRPHLTRGLAITEYPPQELIQLVRWIESDDVLRTEDELLEETMRELGFRKRGSRIVAAITQAIRTARQRA